MTFFGTRSHYLHDKAHPEILERFGNIAFNPPTNTTTSSYITLEHFKNISIGTIPPQDQTKQAKFSEVETQFLLAYIRNLTSTPQVNWDAVAKERGYDKVSSAQKYFSKLKIKHGINMQTEGKQPISPQKRRVGNTPKRAAREVKKSKVAGSDGSPAPTDDFDSGTEEDEF